MQRWRIVRKVLVACAMVLGLWLPASESKAKGDWEWTLVPYLWASDIGMEVKIAGEPVLETDIDFGDLLDKVDLALTLHFEAGVLLSRERRGKLEQQAGRV